VKTKRVTLLATPDFKRFLETEAQREGVSVGELIRVRCGQPSQEERLLHELAAQLHQELKETKSAIKQANANIDRALAELAKSRSERGST
jgi:ribosome recycling factor